MMHGLKHGARHLWPPNGPELSCGDVQLDCRRMFARETMLIPLIIFFSRGEKARRIFRQLERVVSRHCQIIYAKQLVTNVHLARANPKACSQSNP